MILFCRICRINYDVATWTFEEKGSPYTWAVAILICISVRISLFSVLPLALAKQQANFSLESAVSLSKDQVVYLLVSAKGQAIFSLS